MVCSNNLVDFCTFLSVLEVAGRPEPSSSSWYFAILTIFCKPFVPLKHSRNRCLIKLMKKLMRILGNILTQTLFKSKSSYKIVHTVSLSSLVVSDIIRSFCPRSAQIIWSIFCMFLPVFVVQNLRRFPDVPSFTQPFVNNLRNSNTCIRTCSLLHKPD